jgi:exoribonuclease II
VQVAVQKVDTLLMELQCQFKGVLDIQPEAIQSEATSSEASPDPETFEDTESAE